MDALYLEKCLYVAIYTTMKEVIFMDPVSFIDRVNAFIDKAVMNEVPEGTSKLKKYRLWILLSVILILCAFGGGLYYIFLMLAVVCLLIYLPYALIRVVITRGRRKEFFIKAICSFIAMMAFAEAGQFFMTDVQKQEMANREQAKYEKYLAWLDWKDRQDAYDKQAKYEEWIAWQEGQKKQELYDKQAQYEEWIAWQEGQKKQELYDKQAQYEEWIVWQKNQQKAKEDFKAFYNAVKSADGSCRTSFETIFPEVMNAYNEYRISRQQAHAALINLSNVAQAKSDEISAVNIPDTLSDEDKEKLRGARNDSAVAASRIGVVCFEASRWVNSDDGPKEYPRRIAKFTRESQDLRAKAELVYREVAMGLDINLD